MKATRPRKIAIVTAMLSGAGGGAPRSAAIQAGALAKLGMAVTIFTGHSRKYPLTPEQFHLDGCEIVSSKTIGPAAQGISISSLRQLQRRATEFDVIHVNMGWNLNTFIATRIAKRKEVPCIYSLRSHMGAYHFKRHRYLKPLLFALFERHNIQDAYAVHVTSDWESETSRPAIAGQREVKIPNAMDLADFETPVPRAEARSHLDLSADGFHVVSFGRLGKQKNPEFLLSAFREANLPADSHLHFVGPPEKAIKNQLVKEVEQHRLSNQVHFKDFAAGYERRCWLAAGDIFALPSHDENFCIAVIEAVAAGTHSLVSPHVGAIEYLPTETVRVEPVSLTNWIRALERLAKESPKQHSIGTDLQKLFSPQTVGLQWLNAYDDLGV